MRLGEEKASWVDTIYWVTRNEEWDSLEQGLVWQERRYQYLPGSRYSYLSVAVGASTGPRYLCENAMTECYSLYSCSSLCQLGTGTGAGLAPGSSCVSSTTVPSTSKMKTDSKKRDVTVVATSEPSRF